VKVRFLLACYWWNAWCLWLLLHLATGNHHDYAKLVTRIASSEHKNIAASFHLIQGFIVKLNYLRAQSGCKYSTLQAEPDSKRLWTIKLRMCIISIHLFFHCYLHHSNITLAPSKEWLEEEGSLFDHCNLCCKLLHCETKDDAKLALNIILWCTYVSGVMSLQVSLKLMDCNMMPTKWFWDCLVGGYFPIPISIYPQYKHSWYWEKHTAFLLTCIRGVSGCCAADETLYSYQHGQVIQSICLGEITTSCLSKSSYLQVIS
jgi:hypothetical protein